MNERAVGADSQRAPDPAPRLCTLVADGLPTRTLAAEPSRPRGRRVQRIQHPLTPLVVVAIALAVSHMLGIAVAVVPVVPLALLVVSLLLGRYPGEEVLARLAARLRPSRRPRGRLRARGRAPRLIAPSGGLLLALRLSARAPPLAPARPPIGQ